MGGSSKGVAMRRAAASGARQADVRHGGAALQDIAVAAASLRLLVDVVTGGKGASAIGLVRYEVLVARDLGDVERMAVHRSGGGKVVNIAGDRATGEGRAEVSCTARTYRSTNDTQGLIIVSSVLRPPSRGRSLLEQHAGASGENPSDRS